MTKSEDCGLGGGIGRSRNLADEEAGPVGMTDERFTEWVSAGVERIEARLREVAKSRYAIVNEAARYLIELGGKRFRPALVVAACGLGLDSGSIDEEAMVTSAVVVELTHVASLYHDDVMDEAELRRGAPTAHRRYSNSIAIMVGDFLLARASKIGAELGRDFVDFQAVTLARLVEGQIAEMKGPDDPSAPIDHYLQVLADKTGALIAASARYGGMCAGLPSHQVEALTSYGERLGMAFQLADDLLDILSEESGKRPGTDLREGVRTLAPLLALSQNRAEDGRLLELLAAPVSEEDIPEALALLRAHPAVDEARAQVARWASEASQALAGFPDVAATRALHQLCHQAVVRTT